MLSKLWYGPPEWVVDNFPARERRAFGFWCVIAAAIGAVFFGSAVLYVTILSVVALIPNFAAETPSEVEDDEDKTEG